MVDEELAAIRAARLQELQRNSQSGGNGSSASNEGKESANASNPKQAILSQILEPEAKERLSRLRMVKPERVTSVENYLINLYQNGILRHKIDEDEIVETLEKIARDERQNTESKIIFDRREIRDDSIDDDDDDDFFD
ncbi:unnamed protein product [[Candida] boidinii]|uniref:Unnamed protein product n=1 Tax=Candida boidinii TaxID=5477 RepID=A0A9W6SYI1_CANBO|nr:hypothetical protein B5S30_g2818 [[Candida] boidinii]OWB84092.1 hypothetical protein B5S33_g2729 [[Candida] boidinii]GME69325.1 unnamed protein product [[Candida] boidinii]